MPPSRPPKKYLSPDERFRIISLRIQQKSWEEIVRETGEKKSTIRNIVTHFLKHGTYHDLPKPGRRRKLDDRGLRRLERAVLKNPAATIQDLAREATLDSGENAVKRALRELKFGVFRVKRKFWLSKEAMMKRRRWCLKKRKWTEEDWRKIIWCDEVRIEVGLRSGPLRVRRRRGTSLWPRYIQPTFHSGRFGISFWAAYSYGSRTPLIFLRRRRPEEYKRERDRGGLNATQYRNEDNSGREDASYRPTLFCDGDPGAGKSYIVSLVIDKLCEEVVGGDPTVVCFYFDFAARNEQSPVNMLGPLLKQLYLSRGLQVSEILKMLRAITAMRRTFIGVDALDECVLEYRMVVLESLGQILQGSASTRLLMTGRPHVWSEVERELGGAAPFVFIPATDDGVLRFLREKLRRDTMPNAMSSTLKEDIMESIPAISTETFLLASLHVRAILRGTTVARRRKILKSIKDGVELGEVYGAARERIKARDKEKAKLAMAALTWI
ncbi:hypothetical protein B9Z19DRAFT_1135616 [Tuber borchii]|uniref:Nephrocystin 3-like N-terminal domain-containing protein n=1 Tax=Tuber borchii TaxID=42251 RepID=A0A2T6ZCP6_TUBBO|nr:hypothetical protein B9Z19DRAFT_1135616 [Tuber borchii]